MGNWSLRAALTRYGQPQPQRASDLIEVLRRIEVALHGRSEPGEELLRLIEAVDAAGDELAAWANDTSRERPDARIDAVTAEATAGLDALGVPREEAGRPPRGRG